MHRTAEQPLVDRIDWARLGDQILVAAEQAAERHQQLLEALADRRERNGKEAG